MANIAQLVEEGGSSAYQLYQYQSEKMLRERLNDQNEGVFLSNELGIKNARNDSVSRIMVPSDFQHQKSIPRFIPHAPNETALEQEIKRIV